MTDIYAQFMDLVDDMKYIIYILLSDYGGSEPNR